MKRFVSEIIYHEKDRAVHFFFFLQLILFGTKLHSFKLLQSDKNEARKERFVLVAAHKTRLIRQEEKNVLCESGFI